MKNILFFLLISNFCNAQDSNILNLKVLTRRTHEPIIASVLFAYETKNERLQHNPSDSNGIIQFNLAWLREDSAFLSLVVATDTVATFYVYKNKFYGYEMTYYVDTEAIKRRIESRKVHKRRKKNYISEASCENGTM
jgi:hypothetical protein